MGTIKSSLIKTRIIIALAIVSLNPLSIKNSADAGFYDWLTTEDRDPILLTHAPTDEDNNSFENLFAWSRRRLVDKGSESEEEQTLKIKVVKTHTVRATAYSSTPDQTDDTPFITASGTTVRDGIVAANFHVNGRRVPFGTLIRIPEIYGEKIFVVEDRMNARYTNNIDIWFPERQLAKEFGSKKVTIEIVEES